MWNLFSDKWNRSFYLNLRLNWVCCFY